MADMVQLGLVITIHLGVLFGFLYYLLSNNVNLNLISRIVLLIMLGIWVSVFDMVEKMWRDSNELAKCDKNCPKPAKNLAITAALFIVLSVIVVQMVDRLANSR